jgi:hypothetical protein
MNATKCAKHNAAILVAFWRKDIKSEFIIWFLGRMMKNKVFNSDFKDSPTAKIYFYGSIRL